MTNLYSTTVSKPLDPPPNRQQNKRNSSIRYFEELSKNHSGIRYKSPKVGVQKEKREYGFFPELRKKNKFRISSSIGNERNENEPRREKSSKINDLRKRRKERLNLSFVNPEDIKLGGGGKKEENSERNKRYSDRRRKRDSIFERKSEEQHIYKSYKFENQEKTGKSESLSKSSIRKNSSPTKIKHINIKEKEKNKIPKINEIHIEVEGEDINDIPTKRQEFEPEEKDLNNTSLRKKSFSESTFKVNSRREIINKTTIPVENNYARIQDLRNRVESKIQMMKDRRRQELDKLLPLLGQNSNLFKLIINHKPWIPLAFLTKLTSEQIQRNYLLSNEDLNVSKFNEKELNSFLDEIPIVERCSKQLLGKEIKPKEMEEIELHVKYFNKGRELYLKKMKERNHYQKFGINNECSENQLKKSFRILVDIYFKVTIF